MRGKIDASITRRRAMPCTRSSSSTTAIGSLPILHVPTGWKMVVPSSPAAFCSSASDSAPRLRRRHGKRPGAEHQVLERHRRLAENAAGHGVERLDVPHLVLHADLQVVVEILSHAGEIVHDRDLKPVEQLPFSYAGQLQQL